ncbi:MAG: hypothetical protein ACLUW6_05270, partial [Coriobacteriaceae bacterium]
PYRSVRSCRRSTLMSNSEFAEPYTIIEPFGGPFKGDVTVPGDKSISHRAVLFAAMAEGTSHLSGVLDSEDVRASIRAVEALGAEVDLKAQPDGSLSGTVTAGAPRASQPAAPSTAATRASRAPARVSWPLGHRGDHRPHESLKKRPMPHRSAPAWASICRDAGDVAHHRAATAPRAPSLRSPMASAQLKTAALLPASSPTAPPP